MYNEQRKCCTCALCTINVYFYTVNLLYMICGATFVIFGVLMETIPHIHQQILSYDLIIPPKLLIPVGAMMLIVSFIGFCGSKIDHYCMLITYVCLATFFLIFTIGATLALLVFPVRISDSLKDQMKAEQEQYDSNEKSAIYWDRFHNMFKCCGIYKHSEWLVTRPGIPYSCCQAIPDTDDDIENDHCSNNNKRIPFLRKVGCLQKLDHAYHRYSTIIMIFSIAACIIQALCILCVYYIGRRAKMRRKGGCCNCFCPNLYRNDQTTSTYSLPQKLSNNHQGNFPPMSNNMNYGVLNSAFRVEYVPLETPQQPLSFLSI